MDLHFYAKSEQPIGEIVLGRNKLYVGELDSRVIYILEWLEATNPLVANPINEIFERGPKTAQIKKIEEESDTKDLIPTNINQNSDSTVVELFSHDCFISAVCVNWVFRLLLIFIGELKLFLGPMPYYVPHS